MKRISERIGGEPDMRLARAAAAICGTTAICISGFCHAQAGGDFGKQQYDSRCAVCHGSKGKGDGPYASMLVTPVADLTTLTKRNNGVFPFQRVYEVIDGRQALKAHGTRDMPIWGRDINLESWKTDFDVPSDPEVYSRTRILAMVEYIDRLQEK